VEVKIRIYKIRILSVVLYGCDTWSLTLREEHRQRVFENRMLRRIFGLKSDEVTSCSSTPLNNIASKPRQFFINAIY
jgi:hypothetical protein